MARTDPRHTYNINVSLYGDRLTSESWAQHFMSLSHELQAKLGVTYTHFSGGYFEGGGDDLAVRSLRYGDRNTEEIRDLLRGPGIYNLGLLTAEKGNDLTRDAKCSIGFSLPHPNPRVPKPYHHFYLQVVPELLVPVVQRSGLFAFFVTLLQAIYYPQVGFAR